MRTNILPPVKNNSLGSSNIPGVGETSSTTMESMTGTEIDSSDVVSKTFGVESHLGRMTFTESDTGATIEIHNAKASITISKSGHLDVISSSGSGVTVTATAGKVIINAVDILVKSTGSMMLDSGGDLNLNAKGSINLTAMTGALTATSQSFDQTVNGLASINVTKEMSTVVGGHSRMTIAGDSRMQVSGSHQQDVGGALTVRSTGELVLNTNDGLSMYAGQDSTFHSKGKLSIRSTGDADVQTKGKLTVSATGELKMHTQGAASVASTGAMKLSSSAGMNVYASSNMNLDSGADIHLANGGASQESVLTPADPQAPEKAQVVPAESVQDELSTIRQSPAYPYNARRRASAGASRMMNRGPSASSGSAPATQQAPVSPQTPYTGPGAKVTYNNANATRNKPVTGSLQTKLATATAAVYGEGSQVVIYSGGQDPIGTSTNRTGSIRHDNGHAADVYIYRPDGTQVRGSDLALLGQYWLSNGNGSVGMEMPNGGIHLDEWGSSTGPSLSSGMGRYWYYGNGESSLTKQRIMAGASGQSPDVQVATVTGEGQDDSAKKILPQGSQAEKEIKKNVSNFDRRIEKI